MLAGRLHKIRVLLVQVKHPTTEASQFSISYHRTTVSLVFKLARGHQGWALYSSGPECGHVIYVSFNAISLTVCSVE